MSPTEIRQKFRDAPTMETRVRLAQLGPGELGRLVENLLDTLDCR